MCFIFYGLLKIFEKDSGFCVCYMTSSCPESSLEMEGSTVHTTGSEMVVIDTISDGIHFPSLGEEVSVISLGSQVSERIDNEPAGEEHPMLKFEFGSLVTDSSLGEADEVGDIESHLGSGGGGTVFVFEHTIIELSGHTDNHVIEVRVEVFTLGDINTIRSLVVITGQEVIDIVNTSGSKFDLRQINGPDTTVSVLSLILRVVGRVDSIVGKSVSVIPFLVVVLLEMMMGGMDGEVADEGSEFKLFVGLVEQDIVFLEDHTVTVGTVSSEDEETSSD